MLTSHSLRRLSITAAARKVTYLAHAAKRRDIMPSARAFNYHFLRPFGEWAAKSVLAR